jgi:hypothetical protein
MVAGGREEGLSRAWWEIWDIDVYDITQVFRYVYSCIARVVRPLSISPTIQLHTVHSAALSVAP